jgi:hypothetical protein
VNSLWLIARQLRQIHNMIKCGAANNKYFLHTYLLNTECKD